jgi:hypothetical protein
MITTRIRLLVFAIVLFIISALPAFAASGVRIVRLSLAQGDVQIDRNSGDGWEQAINNMPVIGGARLYAADGSRAELEFEDGSSVRLVGPAQISLTQLSTSAAGTPVNVIQVDSGVVYFDARLRNHDDFRILAPTGESFAITQPSRLRLKVDQQVASLSVTEGQAVAQNAGANNAEIRSGQTYNYILGQPESAARQEQVPVQPEDAWNQQREEQNDSAPAQNSGGDDANVAGAADLSNYGTYSDIPGYGVAWQPNDVGPDWDPFGYGAWSYYPDWGWTFVSGYPWGWAPFYYGNWCYIGGRGWWWRPGHGGPHGPWGGGWHPQPRWTGAPGHNFSAPHPPAHVARGTVAVAGSNLHVGPIGETHAALAGRGVSSPSGSGIATGGPAGRVGTNSNLIRGQVVASPSRSSIVGQKGSYSLANGVTTARNGYEVHRPPTAGYSAHAVPQRSYSYAGASAPRAFSGPPVSIQHAPSAPPASSPHVSSGVSAPHVSSGGGGGGFHGGGGGGGGFHGGGGGGHR